MHSYFLFLTFLSLFLGKAKRAYIVGNEGIGKTSSIYYFLIRLAEMYEKKEKRKIEERKKTERPRKKQKEPRKNQERKKKEPRIEELSKYKDNKRKFIHFLNRGKTAAMMASSEENSTIFNPNGELEKWNIDRFGSKVYV